jgi:hypothetical protein
MPFVVAANNVTEIRGFGTADNEILPAPGLSFSVVSPFRIVLEANATPVDPLAVDPNPVRPISESRPRSLEDPVKDAAPIELLTLLLNIFAPGVLSPSAGPHSTDSPSDLSTGSGSRAPVDQTSVNLFTRITLPDNETGSVANPAAASPSGESTDNGMNTPAGSETNPLATVAAPMFSARTEIVPEVLSSTNPDAMRRVSPLIPALAPVVSNLLPSVTMPGEPLIEVPEPIGAVEVQVGLPSTQIGERPSAAGNRIAALAEMGAQLASLSLVESSEFVQQFQHLPQFQHLSPHLLGIPSGTAQPQNQPIHGDLLGIDSPAGNPEVSTLVNAWTNPGMPSVRIPIADSATAINSPLVSGKITTDHGLTDETVTAIQLHLHQLNKEGQAVFRLHLHPPELGPLQIHLSLREGQIHGQLFVSDESVRRLLADQMPELRQRLETLGLNPGQWAIAADPRGSRADSGWSYWQPSEPPPQWWNEQPNYEPATNTPEPWSSDDVDSIEQNRVDVIV